MVAERQRDPARDAATVALATQAADRWYARAPVRADRAAAAARGDWLSADSPERLAKRVGRLMASVRRASDARRADADPALKSMAAAPTLAPVQLSNRVVFEAIVGARDFLSVEFFESGRRAAQTVGRIVLHQGGQVQPLATGFLVGPGLLITNHHVFPDAAIAAQSAVQMDYELRAGGAQPPMQSYELDPDRFFLADEALDYALVAVAPISQRGRPIGDYGWSPLDGRQGKIAVVPIDALDIVQHPDGRPKEIAIRGNRPLDLATGTDVGPAVMGPFLHYATDTEKGSSGAPVFNDQWEVVALHHSGVPRRDADGTILNKDGRPWDEAEQGIEDIDWIANEGVRVSALVAGIAAAPLAPEKRALLDTLLRADAPPAPTPPTIPANAGGPAMTEPAANATATVAASAGSIAFEVPLRITVSLGGSMAVAVSAPAPAATPPSEGGLEHEKLKPDPTTPASALAGRAGYRPDFLHHGTAVPLPRIKPGPRFGTPLALTRPEPGANRFELRYSHYSVLMNGPRRLAYLSAVNVDFGAAANAPRTSHDVWARDGRIPDAAQVDGPYYFMNDYDKGHLSRRADAAWGRTDAEAILSNTDTFHYPNAAPQHKFFNQSDDFTHQHLKLWGDLEDFISKQGGDQRTKLSIFNGPVFGGNDKPLKDIRVPRAFFKIVVWHDAGQPHPGAVGFVLEQTSLIARLPEEAIDPGEFRLRQRAIRAIQASVDVDFGQIATFDKFRAKPAAHGAHLVHEAMGDDLGLDREIATMADIQL